MILEKIGTMGDLVYLRVIVKHLNCCHHPVSNIQLMIWVVLNLMLVLVMLKVVWDIGPPTLPPIKLIFGLVVVILCDIRVGNIYP